LCLAGDASSSRLTRPLQQQQQQQR
jgi:hypothetical protein